MISMLIALIIIAVILALVPMDAQIKKVITTIVIIGAVLWALPYLAASLRSLF